MAKRYPENLYDENLYMEDDELDTIKAFLAFTLMKTTPLEDEEIYTYVFGEGKRILWN